MESVEYTIESVKERNARCLIEPPKKFNSLMLNSNFFETNKGITK